MFYVTTNRDASGLIKTLLRPNVRKKLAVLEAAVKEAAAIGRPNQTECECIRYVLASALQKERGVTATELATLLTMCVGLSIEVLKTVDANLEMASRQGEQ